MTRRSWDCRSAPATSNPALFASRQEFVAGVPACHRVHVGGFGSQGQSELRRFFQAGKVPVVFVFVRWLVVALLVVILKDLFAVARGFARELVAFPDAECRSGRTRSDRIDNSGPARGAGPV